MVAVEIKGDKIKIGNREFSILDKEYFTYLIEENSTELKFFIDKLEDLEKLSILLEDRELIELLYDARNTLSYHTYYRLIRFIEENIDNLVNDKKELKKLKDRIKRAIKVSESIKQRHEELFEEIKFYYTIRDDYYTIGIMVVETLEKPILIIVERNIEREYIKKIIVVDNKLNIYKEDSFTFTKEIKILNLLKEGKILEFMQYVRKKFEKIKDYERKDYIKEILEYISNIRDDKIDKIRILLGASII